MKRLPLFFAVLAVTVGLMLANVFVQYRMNSNIKENKLVDESFVEEGAPPLVAFTTVALGGFRGLIADFLWLRSNSLQEQGKYYELVQLADWIQKLQPKFTGASAFLGWNMAYNISVACKRREDRWRWVHRGIETLRSAIAMNPNDPILYKELGWIYQHKMGNVLDDAQRYYKYEMAKNLFFLYGTHYPDWKALAAAPENEAQLKAKYPETLPVWQKIKDAGYEKILDLEQEFRLNGELPKKLAESMTPVERDAFSNYFRSRWMRMKYLLQPKKVLEINEKYGELDWLIPESFAIYWATLGIEHSPKRESIECSRMILQSLSVTFSNGRMLLPQEGEASEFFMLVPNTRVSNALREYYKQQINDAKNKIAFKAAYENFMIDATVVLFSYGQKAEAYKFYKILRDEIKYNDARKNAFEPFVLMKWEEDLRDGGFKQGNQQINAMIFSACRLLAYGDYDAAEAHLRLAKRAYDHYCAEFTEDRVKLPPFNEMKRNITLNIIQNFPEIAKRLRAEIAAEDAEKAKNEPAASANVPVQKK